jgi:hypothetical protein
MSKSNGKQNTHLNRIKGGENMNEMAIIDRAVGAIIETQSKIDAANTVASEAEGNQLRALAAALEEFPGPMTEEVWDRVYRAKVAERLEKATVNGVPRYASKASRDVTVNTIKVATIGLTLAKIDPSFAAASGAKSLKKYADEVRPRLQRLEDPETGKPRLSSGKPKPPQSPKRLAGDTHYWLVGCKDADKGVEGPNTIIAAGHDLNQLKEVAQKLTGKFASFRYLTSKMEQLEVRAETYEAVSLPIVNAAVFADTLSAEVA